MNVSTKTGPTHLLCAAGTGGWVQAHLMQVKCNKDCRASAHSTGLARLRPPPTAKAQATLTGATCPCCPGACDAVTAVAGGVADPEVCPEPAAVTSLPLDCGCLKIMSILGTCCGYM